MSKYDIYTDGSALGNPGFGGWACVIHASDQTSATEIFGGEANTTNNRMEVMAVICALQHIPAGSDATITSDSKYVCDAFNQGWLANWRRNGWKTANKTSVKNADLWQVLDALTASMSSVEFIWVKGHAGHPENERCDELARAFAEDLKAAETLRTSVLEPEPEDDGAKASALITEIHHLEETLAAKKAELKALL